MVPLIILACLAVVVGYLNAAPFKIEKFTDWVESSIGVELPEARARDVQVGQRGARRSCWSLLGFVVSLASVQGGLRRCARRR